MDIIQRNFFRLIRSGAFNDKSQIEVMSAFKWRRLYEIVMFQNVLDYFVRGVNNNANDKNLNLPDKLVEEIQAKLDLQEERRAGTQAGKVVGEETELSSSLLNKRFHKIIYNEMHSIDTSVETLRMLQLIVFNTNAMLNRGINLDGIIRLGQFLRGKGDKVDFLKLENWLSSLHLQRMAQLQGSCRRMALQAKRCRVRTKQRQDVAQELAQKL